MAQIIRTAWDEAIQESAYGATWQAARTAAFTVAQQASPLARRAYDLRHAALSWWLNAGIPATEVARRVGHSVAVLLKVYAHCIDGRPTPPTSASLTPSPTQMTSPPQMTSSPVRTGGGTASPTSGPHQVQRVNLRTEPRSVRRFTGQRPAPTDA